MKFNTVEEAYNWIFQKEYDMRHYRKLSNDKARRAAIIKAVQNAWKVFNETNAMHENKKG